MSEENSRGTVPSKKEIIKKLRTASELYALMSPCTKMPYVQCDPETMDDEIFLYPEEETGRCVCPVREFRFRPSGSIKSSFSGSAQICG